MCAEADIVSNLVVYMSIYKTVSNAVLSSFIVCFKTNLMNRTKNGDKPRSRKTEYFKLS